MPNGSPSCSSRSRPSRRPPLPDPRRCRLRRERDSPGRTCYSHLAGLLGVSITDALVRRHWLELDDRMYDLTAEGEQRLFEAGWIERTDESRVTRPTAAGRRALKRHFDVELW